MKRIITFLITLALITAMLTFPVSAQEKAVLNISAKDGAHNISDKLYGLFLENTSYACDGGLVSNLVNNNSFENELNKTEGWIFNGVDVSTEEASTPINKNNSTYATITVNGKGSATNLGFTEVYDYKTYKRDAKKTGTADMGFKKNTEYDFSCYINNKDFDGTISVYLDSPKNRLNITELDISKSGNLWNRLNTTLTSSEQEDGGLTIEFNGTGTICLDFVILIPKDSHGYGTNEWKYTTLRPDLYTALEQLNPSFIRFPGGCLTEGNSLENLYSWKGTIGPLEERAQYSDLYKDDEGKGYLNTMSMGFHEYFQLCSDLGAEAVPVINAGLVCQKNTGYEDHVLALEKSYMSDAEWEEYLTEEKKLAPEDTQARDEFTNYIDGLNIKSENDFEAYIDTIALRPGTKEWDAYVQDILDLIEYANGDAITTYWGAIRAANGSIEPFNLKYIELGNESYGDVYERNFRALYKEIKKTYPEITVISAAGESVDGKSYEQNMSWIIKDFSDTIVDEHHYTNLFEYNDRYDSFDRNGTHVLIGGYSASDISTGTVQTKSNISCAVEEAGYLTGIERNGDVVEMAAYAPTLAKVNAQYSDVNLIWFDSQELVLTPGYYAQELFANNYGTKYLESVFSNGETVQDGIYESVTVDENSQILYVKLVNTSGRAQSVDVNISDFGNINRISVQSIKSGYKSACNEIGKNTTYPLEQDLTAGENVKVDMGKYDVMVLRIAYGDNDGGSLYALPDFISTMTADTSDYIPDSIKIAIPCIAAGAAVIAVIIAVSVIIKKKKKIDK